MKDLAAFGQRQRLKRDILMGPFADDAVLLQANQKAQFLFPEELEVLHPGVPAIRAHHGRAQPPAEHLLDHLPEECTPQFHKNLI
jgi:hypothetical protein